MQFSNKEEILKTTVAEFSQLREFSSWRMMEEKEIARQELENPASRPSEEPGS